MFKGIKPAKEREHYLQEYEDSKTQKKWQAAFELEVIVPTSVRHYWRKGPSGKLAENG